jgi:hypothetical protein
LPWAYVCGVFVLVCPPPLRFACLICSRWSPKKLIASLVLFAPAGRFRRPLRGQRFVASLVLFAPAGRFRRPLRGQRFVASLVLFAPAGRFKKTVRYVSCWAHRRGVGRWSRPFRQGGFILADCAFFDSPAGAKATASPRPP